MMGTDTQITNQDMKVDIYGTAHRYEILLVDPPWRQARGGKKAARPNSSGKPLEYQTLSIDDIEKIIRVATELMKLSSVLFLWTIDKYLFESQKIAEGIGYKLHARMIWNKVVGIPAAFTVRYGHEYLLYMYRGKLLPIEKAERGKVHTVFTECATRHSKKPDAAYKIVERLYPNARKLELFARYERDGWDAWGDEL
jgi:N6-adenosine-specific RNA methylase IME4